VRIACWRCRGGPIWGSRYVGAAAVKDALRTRFAGIPDVSYSDESHFVAGNMGMSQWTLRGMSTKGERIEVRGCDFYTFRDGKIAKKDSFWKIREP